VLAPEKIDMLLHGQVLRNPPLPKESEMRVAKTIGEQLREKLDAASKREELKTTLNEWDQDEQKQLKGEVMPAQPKHLFGVTNNASRETFYFIKDNPHLGIGAIKAGMVARGFKESTVSSLAYQMVVAGLCAKNNIDHTFVAIADEFKPFNINKLRREAKLKQMAEDKAKVDMLNKTQEGRKVVMITRRTAEPEQNAHVAGIGALPVKAEPQVTYTLKWRPEDTVDQLTLVQAKAVHAYLQKLFGAL
jgi:hypothetical protein